MSKANAIARWAERSLLHKGGRTATWGSLGLWRDDPVDYAAACEALARAVAVASGMGAGERVLSVACGAGDELRLWTEAFGAKDVVGVESNPQLCEAAHKLAGVPVMSGSATALGALGLAPGSFDRIVCVDSAYLLRPRSAFLQGALALLRPGGRLAWTDLVLRGGRSGFRRAMLVPGALICGVPWGELLHEDDAASRVAQAGFEQLQVQPLDEEVLGGFASFVWAQGSSLGTHQLSAAWKRPAYTAGIIKLARPFGLGYSMFAASRPGGSAAAPASMAAATS